MVGITGSKSDLAPIDNILSNQNTYNNGMNLFLPVCSKKNHTSWFKGGIKAP
jgi:hypothetical protein